VSRSMRMSFLSPANVAAAAPLLHPGLRLPDDLREALPALWVKLLASGQLSGMVIEDSAQPPSQRIVGVGMSAFLDPGFATSYLARPEPYPAAQVYRALRDGAPALLPAADVPRANAEGTLTLLVLHYGQLAGLDQPRGQATLRLAHTAFRFNHEGFGVARVLQEGYGDQRNFLKAGGMIEKSDYAAHYAERGGMPPSNMRPFLMGLERTDVEAQLPGTTVSYLFQRASPRMFFAPSEQRVLMCAMIHDSDEDIAARLAVSPNTLKKVWRSIYARAEQAEPGLWPATQARMASGSDMGTRGREKRRVLLEYLRHHMTELRPVPRDTKRPRAVG